MSSDPVISIRGLSKAYRIYNQPHDRLKQSFLSRIGRLFNFQTQQYYHEFRALHDISFDIRKGETVGVIGRNGSGKSTLLQLICGTLTPTAGHVGVNGRVAALLELGSGFNPEFTGRENVYMNAAILGLDRQQIDDRFDAIAEFADIGEFIDQPVKLYSSGMFVRLAFAVIANVDADILVIDEALAVGDAYFVQKCMRFLREFTRTGTLLFVSHDTASVVGLCSKAILLEQGAVRAFGNPKEVTDLYLARQHEEELDMLQGNAEEIVRDKEENDEFGTGEVRIVSVSLQHADGSKVISISGGEEVRLSVTCHSRIDVDQPIVGFFVRDRLGQIVFGANTLHVRENAVRNVIGPLPKEVTITVTLVFTMPVLQTGDYSLGIAIAEGTQVSHVQHHWIHDALIFHCRPDKFISGMIGMEIAVVEVRSGS